MRYWAIITAVLINQDILAITEAQINYILKDYLYETAYNVKSAYYFDQNGMLNKFCARYNLSEPPRDGKYYIKAAELELDHFFLLISPDGKEIVLGQWGYWGLFDRTFDCYQDITISGSRHGGYIITRTGEYPGRAFQVVWLDEDGKVRTKSKVFDRGNRPSDRFYFVEDDGCLYLVDGEPLVGRMSLHYSVLTKDTIIRYSIWKAPEEICGQKFWWFYFMACALIDDENILVGDIITKECYSTHNSLFYLDTNFEDVEKRLLFFVINPEGKVLRHSKLLKFDEEAFRKYPDALLLNIEMVRLGNGQIAVYIPTLEDGKPYVYEVRLTGKGEVIKSKNCETVSAREITTLPKGRWAKVRTYILSYTDKSLPGVIIYGFDEKGNLYYRHGNMRGLSK